MARAFLVVLDSVGCGGAPDAADFGDAGANTLLHIAEHCASSVRGPLKLPNLDALGLGAAIEMATGAKAPGFTAKPQGLFGAATEVSKGKDTPSGHWELAGLPVPWAWHYFPQTGPAFDDGLVAEVCRLAGTEGILGNCHASGVPIIEEHCRAHIEKGWPICYTSADSVFQIAAHEEHFGLERLLKLCEDLAPSLHAMKVGRVIARPFTGTPGAFKRTKNRKDFAILPPAPTLNDWVHGAGRQVNAVGKIGDIFSMRGIDEVRTGEDRALMGHLSDYLDTASDGSLTFANFVEFDSLYGHPRDPIGYASHLEWFDSEVPALLGKMRADDIIIFTADHGNDPTWRGTDHTRERVPVVGFGVGKRDIGHIGFVDVAASLATHLGVPFDGPGRSFL